MITTEPTRAGASLKALWKRAPQWRFFLMSAALLTLLFELFPPREPAVPTPAPPAEQATYTSRTPAPAAPLPSPQVPRVAAASLPKPGPAPIASSKTPGGVAPPRTAALAMVAKTAGDAKNESGLNDALMGGIYRGSVAVDGYSVPLPAGDWVNLANSTIAQPTATGNAHFLGRIHDRRLVGAVRIFAARSKEQPGDGFNEVKSCTEVNPGRTFVSIDDDMVAHGHQACWTIRNVYATPWSQWADRAIKISPLDRAAAGDMTAKGVSFPQDFVGVTFTRTETWGLLEVMYLFSPESEGISSNTVLSVGEADWVPANISRYPEKVAYVEKLKSWGTAFWPKFKASFDRAK